LLAKKEAASLRIKKMQQLFSWLRRDKHMRYGTGIRGMVYWSWDLAKGGRVTRHIRDLSSRMENPCISSEREALLGSLMHHACTSAPAYREFRGLPFEHFPVLSKEKIRQSPDDFLSSDFKKESLKQRSTSGSHGTPLTFYHDRDKTARREAEAIYFNGWAGYKVGRKLLFINATHRPKSNLALWMHNQVMVLPKALDEGWIVENQKKFQSLSVEVIVGCPPTLEALAEYCNNEGLSFPYLLGVVSTSSTLYSHVKGRVEQVLRVPVLSRYSCTEMGILAHQCPEGGLHHINSASYVVELLQLDKDEPVGNGELGRVVVTDLYSRAMPLIRFDTGDLAVQGEACCCGLLGETFSSIEGRMVEIVRDTRGERMAPQRIIAVMPSGRDVFQHQFVQLDANSYEVNLVVRHEAAINEDEARNKFVNILGPTADVRINYVSEIKPLPSGKRPLIINRTEHHR
jgi:phenylacetate-CoA ligase